MAEALTFGLSLAIGVSCSLMPCCIGAYPGLFSYLQGNRTSRFGAAIMSLGFTGGMLVIVAAISLVFVWLQIALMEWMAYAMTVIPIVGAAFMIIIGASYFVGRSFRIPLPTINPPVSLRGYRAAPVYGLLLGGPGAAHCTSMLVIPVIILGLAALQPLAVLYALAAYVLGRAIPIVIIGTMMQDAQLRFVQMIAGRSTLVNRVIGIAVIVSGISLFFIR
ncbi:MAG: hypothetical protein ACREUU_02530 [Gammaproteobacteria bacterium]